MTWPLNLSYPASASEVVFPDHDFTITLDGLDITDQVTAWSISGSRGQAVTGSITVVDNSSFVASIVNSFKNTEPHDMSTGPEITFNVTVGSESPTYPTFVVTGVSGSTVIKIDFSDKTVWVNRDNQEVDDVLADEGDSETAYNIIDDLEALTPGVTITPSFTDWPVRTFRMNEENIIQKIDEICAITRSYRRFEGDTMFLETLGSNTDSWTIEDRLHIPEGGFNLSKSVQGLKTEFKAFRLAPQAASLAPPYSCTGNDCIGLTVDIKFARPAANVDMRVLEVRKGVIENGVFHDDNGDPLTVGPTDSYRGGTVKAYGWQATYTPDIGATAYTPYYLIETLGSGSQVTSASAFDAEIAVAAVEALYGKRPEFKNMATDLILDEATMIAMLAALGTEVEWSVRKYNLSTPFLSPGLCGSQVFVTYFPLGISNEEMKMESFTHGWTGASGFACSYGLAARTT